MTTPVKLTVLDCIVCDDIRQERSGKDILIGVYVTAIVVPKFPWRGILSLYLLTTWEGEGNVKIEIRIMNPDGEPAGSITGNAQAVHQGRRSAFIFRGVVCSAIKEGPYDFQWRMNDGDWNSIQKTYIQLPTPNP
jgi:hypothetical protein